MIDGNQHALDHPHGEVVQFGNLGRLFASARGRTDFPDLLPPLEIRPGGASQAQTG
jgi:hypothetical protein